MPPRIVAQPEQYRHANIIGLHTQIFPNLPITISHDIVFKEIDCEAVLLDLQSESYFGLDEVGTRIWQLLNETSNLKTVFDTLLGEYDVDEKQLEKDLQDHIAHLVEEGLISLTDPAPDDPKG